MQMDDVARAIRTYEKVVEMDDSCAIGHYNLGSACHARRDLDKAAKHFGRTISLEPGYADAHFNLGIVHQERGRLEDALKCYDEAAKLDATLADAASGGAAAALGLYAVRHAALYYALRKWLLS